MSDDETMVMDLIKRYRDNPEALCAAVVAMLRVSRMSEKTRITEQSRKRVAASRNTRKKEFAGYSDAFTAIWREVLKVDNPGPLGAKLDAYRAWTEVGEPDFAQQWGAYCAHLPIQRSNKHVSTWLRARGWEDTYRTTNGSHRTTQAAVDATRSQADRDLAKIRATEAAAKASWGKA